MKTNNYKKKLKISRDRMPYQKAHIQGSGYILCNTQMA